MQNPNKSLKLKNESDKDFTYFCRFLELDTMAELIAELKGKQSERNLYYIAKMHKWNERKSEFLANINSKVLDLNLDRLSEIRSLEIENTLDTLLMLEKAMNKSNKKMQIELDKILEDDTSDFDKIAKVMKSLNQIINSYQRNKKQLKEKLIELGIEKSSKPKEYTSPLIEEVKSINLNNPVRQNQDIQYAKDLQFVNSEISKFQKHLATIEKIKNGKNVKELQNV
ncbi:MAG: hypothetical protein NTW25_04640 [Candidatus Kapabacteria bacterium]|nr:hypothetical protein [Candidatus Kapabacteria bacterium]